MDKLLENPSFKAILFLIGVIVAGLAGLLPMAHGYILQDVERSITGKVYNIERNISDLKTQTELNHQLLMQEFRIYKEQQNKINEKLDRLAR